MTQKKQQALRDALRRGDPGAGDGLGELEAARMRREIVAAAWQAGEEGAEERPGSWWMPRLALAASILLACLLALWTGLGREPGTAPGPELAQAPGSGAAPAGDSATAMETSPPRLDPPAVVSDPRIGIPALSAAPQPPAPEAEVAASPRPLPPIPETAPQVAAAPRESPNDPASAPPDTVVPAVAARGPQQLRFVAPRGTRIVWTVDPEFSLDDSLSGP